MDKERKLQLLEQRLGGPSPPSFPSSDQGAPTSNHTPSPHSGTSINPNQNPTPILESNFNLNLNPPPNASAMSQRASSPLSKFTHVPAPAVVQMQENQVIDISDESIMAGLGSGGEGSEKLVPDVWMAQSSSTQSETSAHSNTERSQKRKRRVASEDEKPEPNLGGDVFTGEAHSNDENVGRNVRIRTIPAYFAPRSNSPHTKDPAQVPTTGADAWTSNIPTGTKKTTTGPNHTQISISAANTHPTPNPIVGRPTNVRSSQNDSEDLRHSLALAESRAHMLQAQVQELNAKVNESCDKAQVYMEKLEDVLRKVAVQEARERREKLAADSVRLGKIISKWTGPATVSESWEDGYASKDLMRRSAELLARKEQLDNRKKAVQKSKATNRRLSAGGKVSPMDEFEIQEELYSVSVHLEQLKRDEAALSETRRELEAAKATHYKELKRVQHEEKSRLNKLPLLHRRYLLQFLQGKGGFSEVWKGFDLVELRDVAVKVHQLNPAWSDEKKHNYTKHVTREYAIHRDLSHPRVVRLFDVFEIDVNSFATVLEFCRGTDLDEHLKKHKKILERDAKCILIQILSGLRYLNLPGGEGGERRQGVIHFDLKPGNILFDEMGDVKITDFGLSKIMDDSDDGTSMELTSQGAGTYWYLPPECFQTNPRISGKVDVWSVGVIFYQMLFGKRPFGEGKTQDRILSEQVMLRATEVEFPAEPKVTKEAMDFIRTCLSYDQRHRPDVQQLCAHSYLWKK